MVNLPPVSGLIPTRDKPNEGGVIRELEEFDGLVTGGAGVCIQYGSMTCSLHCKSSRTLSDDLNLNL